MFRDGDVLSLVNTTKETEGLCLSKHHVLLVHRMLVLNDEEPRVFMVIVPKRHLQGMMQLHCVGVKFCVLNSIEIDDSSCSEDWHKRCRQSAPACGFLEDGSHCYVHRVLLYSDDFLGYQSRKGSYGGVCMLPITEVGTPEYSSLRVLGLTPPGISSNNVFLDLVSNIVECATAGVKVVIPSGETARVFLDIVGYIGEFPAVTHIPDTLGHNGTSCCHL